MTYVFLSDVGKFASTGAVKKLWPLHEFQSYMRSQDQKYHDEKILAQYISDLMAVPITSDQLAESKRQQKKGTDWAAIWEDFRPLVPLYKRTNLNGQSQIFFVDERNEVAKIDYTDVDALVDALMHRKSTFQGIREYFQQTDSLADIRAKMSLKAFLVKMLTEYLMLDERHLLDWEPAQISWEPDVYAYKKMDIAKLKSGTTPTWDEFTSRLDYPAVFMAWVWSIFEPTNNLRQVLWLKGAGNDGKSSVQKAIESVIGRDYCYSMKPGDESQQWFQKNVFGKVLVNYADCRNVYLIDANSIKQLTGGDTTSIEGKGENSFTGKIYSKLLVTSNYCPRINPELQAHTSRLIKLEVSPQSDMRKDAGFEHRLRDEIYAFLHKCQAAFEALISTGNERLELPQELQEKIKVDCASETYLNVQDFVQEHVEFSTEDLANPADLKRTAKDYFLLEKRLTAEQYKYHLAELEAKLFLYGCSLLRHGNDGKQVTMWRGFKLKTRPS